MLEVFNKLAQDTRSLRLTTSMGADKFIVECLRGEEGLSQCFEFKITVLSTDNAVSARSLMGRPALLELLTSASRAQLRPFHGHITAVETLAADGSLARYAFTLAPWYAFLGKGRDSRIFQEKTVFDILDAIFGGWVSLGALAPAWRFDIRNRSIYPRRSLTTQYQESNLDFAERLMREEGLFYYFEHQGNPSAEPFGSHTLVIADHNGSFQPNCQAQVEFAQPSAVMKADRIDRWRNEMRSLPEVIGMSSWDYRVLGNRAVAASSASHAVEHGIATTDTPGMYAYPTRVHGQRIADNQMQALDCARNFYIGAGTVRSFSPGTTFTLQGHARGDMADGDDSRAYAIVKVLHLAHNNLCLGQLKRLPSLSGAALSPPQLKRNRNAACMPLAG